MGQMLGGQKTQTTPLHPQLDGMVEKFTRTILNNLLLFIPWNQQDSDQSILLFLLTYQPAVHKTTNYAIPNAIPYWTEYAFGLLVCTSPRSSVPTWISKHNFKTSTTLVLSEQVWQQRSWALDTTVEQLVKNSVRVSR